MWENRFSTLTMVPLSGPIGTRSSATMLSTVMVHGFCPSYDEAIVSLDTAEMECRASPRKPMVCRWYRSSSVVILLVAYWVTASGRSSFMMPPPSSLTRISSIPPPLMDSVISFAPASTALSISSLTTLCGRSMTSPAAMRAESLLSSLLICDISMNLTGILSQQDAWVQGMLEPQARHHEDAWRRVFRIFVVPVQIERGIQAKMPERL